MTRLTRVEGWGVTGWSNEFGPLADDAAEDSPLDDAYGFERILDPGVIHRPQPDLPGVPRWVEKPGAKGRVFHLGWPAPEPPVTQSLLDLHAGLASRRRELSAEDPDLARLDAAIQELVFIAARLSAAQASVGFLQPDSVRIGTRHDGTTFVLLPDVGFAWDATGGLYEPEWLASPQAELLFDRGARARNSEYLSLLESAGDERDLRSRAKESAAAEIEDVRIVVRLVALALVGPDEVRRWCGAAKSFLKLPGRNVAPDTAAPIWDQVIAPALDGRIPTFEELALRLQAAKPSEHFLFKPPAPPWRGWQVLGRVAAACVAAVVLGGLWQLKDVLFPPRVQPPFCRRVPEGDPLLAQLFELRDLQERSRVDEAARPAFGLLLRECRQAHAAVPGCGDDCLRQPAEEYYEMMVAAGDAVLARLRAGPRPVAAERPEIEAAIVAIGDAAGEAKREPRPAVVKRLERQLRLREGGATRGAESGATRVETNAQPEEKP